MIFELNFDTSDIIREIEQDAEEITSDVIKFIAKEAPGEMQQIMLTSTPRGNPAPKGGFRSAKGQPPAIDTRELLISLQGIVLSSREAEIRMADHGFYLDPFFADEPGGGYLDRPFIEKGIENTLSQL